MGGDLPAGADPVTRRLASELIAQEREGEVLPTLQWMAERAAAELAAEAGGSGGPPSDPL